MKEGVTLKKKKHFCFYLPKEKKEATIIKNKVTENNNKEAFLLLFRAIKRRK